MIAVTVNALPSAPIVTSPVTYCQNATATALTATGTSLKWYTVSTGGAASTAAPIPVTTIPGTTDYYVSQITTCESERARLTVTVNPETSATITAGGPLVFCEGGNVVLSASNGSSYKWMKGSVQVGTSATYTATTSGEYTVEVTNASNCKAISSETVVTVNSLPVAVITASGPLTFSQGNNVLLTASAGSSYKWFNGTSQVGSSAAYNALSSGNYTVEITNDFGCINVSSVVTVTVIGNQVPSITITTPVNNSTFTAPANVTLTAVAADVDGTIVKVDFFNGGNFLGTDQTSVYDFTFNNLSAGTYTVTAVATDNLGLFTVSAPITFTVNAQVNQLPLINITSPLNGGGFVEAATIAIQAEASDSDGSISQVEFYHGNSLLGMDATSPYSFTWSPVTAGTYVITAKATDNSGGTSTSSPVTITVNGNQPSVITINSPVNNSSSTGTSVTIDVSATDPDGNITVVEYYDGTALIGSSTNQPYIFTWENPAAGTHVITVKVIDSNGGITTSSPSTVTVNAQTGIFSTNGKDGYCRLYPNPALNNVHIETNTDLETASFTLIDSFGSEVDLPLSINNHIAILDVSAIPSGVYLLMVIKDDFVLNKKIIVIH
jgi:hypothetical protein